MERIRERRGTPGMGGTGPGTAKGEGWCKRGGQRSKETKRCPLVEDVSD